MERKIAMRLFIIIIIPFLSIGPVMLLCFASPLSSHGRHNIKFYSAGFHSNPLQTRLNLVAETDGDSDAHSSR